MSTLHGKSNVDKHSALNSDPLEKEREKWEKEQKHIESQMIGIIENNRRYEAILEKDEKIRLKLEEQQKKMEKKIKSKIKKNEERMKEAYEKAKKPLRQQRGKNIKQYREDIRKAKAIEAAHGKEIEDDDYRNKSQEESPDNKEKPPHIQCQERSHELFMANVQRLHKETLEVEKALTGINSKEEKAKNKIEKAKQEHLGKLDVVMEKIENNRLKAASQYLTHQDEVATNFIRKLIKIQKGREKREKSIDKLIKEKEEKYKTRMDEAKERRTQTLKDRRDKLRNNKKKYNQRVQALGILTRKEWKSLMNMPCIIWKESIRLGLSMKTSKEHLE